MVGESDGADYGKLKVYVMPRSRLPNGPALVQGEIQRDQTVSQAETLLSGSGSKVSYGSLTAIPIDNGLLYVRPFYVTSSQTEVPGLEKVIVYFGGDVVIRDTLQEALTAEFGNAPPTLEAGTTPGGGTTPPAAPTGTITQQVAKLLPGRAGALRPGRRRTGQQGPGQVPGPVQPGPRQDVPGREAPRP